MEENKYFQEALAGMVAKEAYVDAVRHMHNLGMTPKEIKTKLSYPVSLERIKKVISDYEEEKNGPDAEYEFVQKTNRYGQTSFIKVKKGE